MVKDYEFHSGFAKELNEYRDFKVLCGFKASSFRTFLRKFDRFCVSRGITKPVFNKVDADEWIKKREGEGRTTHYRRMNALKLFLAYLAARDYEVCAVRDIRYRPSSFKPHIYTEDEVRRYFKAVDSFSSPNPKDAIQFPVLFRLLYCCGTRVGETLSIQKRDIDLENGAIRLRLTKGNKERYVVLGEDLKTLLTTFAEKCFYGMKETDFVFTSGRGNMIDHKRLINCHRKFLREAGIPYLGEGMGPRIHDWRHSMAVQSFKRLDEAGMDMYVALPILSTYLGHSSTFATEGYLRLTMQLYPQLEKKMKAKLDTILGENEYEEH